MKSSRQKAAVDPSKELDRLYQESRIKALSANLLSTKAIQQTTPHLLGVNRHRSFISPKARIFHNLQNDIPIETDVLITPEPKVKTQAQDFSPVLHVPRRPGHLLPKFHVLADMDDILSTPQMSRNEGTGMLHTPQLLSPAPPNPCKQLTPELLACKDSSWQGDSDKERSTPPVLNLEGVQIADEDTTSESKNEEPVRRVTRSRRAANKSMGQEKQSQITKNTKSEHKQEVQRSTTMRKPTSMHILDSWFIRQMKDGYCVEGHRKDDPRDSFWHSSMIMKRVSACLLATGKGSLYKLVGPPDHTEFLRQGFPKKVANAFNRGFPENWMALLHQENQFRASSKMIQAYKNCKSPKFASPVVTRNRARRVGTGKEVVDTAKLKKVASPPRSKRKKAKPILSLSSVKLEKVDLTDLPTTKHGRRVKPPLAFWTGQRVTVCPRTQVVQIISGTPSNIADPKTEFKINKSDKMILKKGKQDLINQSLLRKKRLNTSTSSNRETEDSSAELEVTDSIVCDDNSVVMNELPVEMPDKQSIREKKNTKVQELESQGNVDVSAAGKHMKVNSQQLRSASSSDIENECHISTKSDNIRKRYQTRSRDAVKNAIKDVIIISDSDQGDNLKSKERHDAKKADPKDDIIAVLSVPPANTKTNKIANSKKKKVPTATLR